jgi:hypothetical protein
LNDSFGHELTALLGNNHTYTLQGGNNIISSTLHWGPDAANDQWWQTNSKLSALHTTYSSSWHTFGLEWDDKFLFTYVDSRLLQVLYTPFNKPFWQKGAFPPSTPNVSIENVNRIERHSTHFRRARISSTLGPKQDVTPHRSIRTSI